MAVTQSDPVDEQATAVQQSIASVATVSSTRRPRKIILFSDGTGNSSGKLFKTNVWRLYEALDLGPATVDTIEQIALYNNGVGTSSFRPLAMLGGIFGLGLKANILELYKFLCRNWQPGDEIYLFGFSRGAFSIRLLTGLITSQGIIRGDELDVSPDEDKLAFLARAAYRAFSGESWPNRQPSKCIAGYVRRVRDSILDVHRKITGRVAYHPKKNCMTDIAFVGVWDTVAAYGGPIVEITRGIDDYIWPLTMPNYQLSPKVLKARHALSLDDERDAFQPLLWDEVREELLIRWGGSIRVNKDGGLAEQTRRVTDGRLKQVWFSGMHADVGGGYPDESLSYVSLLWMMDEVDGGLRLLPDIEARIKEMANSFGPIHNSRAGLGGYYRFQPRRISSMTDWLDLSTLDGPLSEDAKRVERLARATRSHRDPEIADKNFERPPITDETQPQPSGDDLKAIEMLTEHAKRDHGLLRSVRVHESAIARVFSGTDNYAPLSLPERYDIVFATRRGSSLRQLDVEAAKQIRDNQRASDAILAWGERQKRIWDMVWWRRVQYFTTVFLTLVLVSMPLWAEKWDSLNPPGRCEDRRCVVQPVLQLINTVTGGYAGPWVRAIGSHVVFTLVVGGILCLLLAYSTAYDLRLRGRARQAWRRGLSTDPDTETLPPRTIARIRDKPWYQKTVGQAKWRVAPTIAGLAMICLAILLSLAAVSQIIVFPIEEESDRLCGTTGQLGGNATMYRLSEPCHRLIEVTKGKTYTLRVTAEQRTIPVKADDDLAMAWRDGSVSTTPNRDRLAREPQWGSVFAIPFRRVLTADWLQPLVEVQADKPKHWYQRLGSQVSIERLYLTCDSQSGSYVATFKPKASGTLSIGVNDAINPFVPDYFYRDNVGRAMVEVVQGSNLPVTAPGNIVPAKCVVSEDHSG